MFSHCFSPSNAFGKAPASASLGSCWDSTVPTSAAVNIHVASSALYWYCESWLLQCQACGLPASCSNGGVRNTTISSSSAKWSHSISLLLLWPREWHCHPAITNSTEFCRYPSLRLSFFLFAFVSPFCFFLLLFWCFYNLLLNLLLFKFLNPVCLKYLELFLFS